MSYTRDKYYWTQLRTALTAGSWSSQSPAKEWRGTPVTWPDLLRKFNKHCRGYTDIAEIASHTRLLSIALAVDEHDIAINANAHTLTLGDECRLAKDQIVQATESYQALQKLQSSNFDSINFALAYYAYALGNPAGCIAHLDGVPDIFQLAHHIPSQATTRSNTLEVPGSSAVPSVSSAAGSFVSDLSISAVDIKDGRAWAMAETFRSLCLRGMSQEKLHPTNPLPALEEYSTALSLLAGIENELDPTTPPTAQGKLAFTSFTQYRELWRWIECLIWRATILSAQMSAIPQDGDVLWTWLRHYSLCSAYWPPNFRTAHRSAVSVLYLRTLVLHHQNMPAGKPAPWLPTARSLIQDYRAILSVCTTFPRAGERNWQVEEFVDLCVAIWETSGAVGAHTGWVLDVLWWATRLTFNSYRILRHMTRLMDVSGDTPLAKRTLKLYVQVVGKAWQTEGRYGQFVDTDRGWVQTLVSGARMLCRSAMSTLDLDDIEDVREAGRLLEKARTRLDEKDVQLCAKVQLAEGVYHSVLALKEQNVRSRPGDLASAHTSLLASHASHETPEAHFHLALSFARAGPARDIAQASEHASRALEGDPAEVRYWHLLGLLLAAEEKWDAAEEILKRGAEVADADLEGDDEAEKASTVGEGDDNKTGRNLSVPTIMPNSQNTEGITTPRDAAGEPSGPATPIDGLPISNGFHSRKDTEAPIVVYLLAPNASEIPPAADLLQPIPDHNPLSPQEVYENALQLRMSLVVLTENVQGAEGAADKWLEIFQWISDRKRNPSETSQRASIDGGRPSMDIRLKSPSQLLLSTHLEQAMDTSATALNGPTASLDGTMAQIPITISPATPNADSTPGRASIERGSISWSETEKDTSKSKKMQQMLKNRVHKGQARITTISKKIGSGVSRSGSLRRSTSTPDFHAVLRQTSYQASSIHSRRRLSSFLQHPHDRTPNESPPPPPPPPLPPVPESSNKRNTRTARENRLLSDLWLMSAATFRRLGKIEQAKGAIQEAEVKDESNPGVWVQLGLYYVALGCIQDSIDSFQKALLIQPEDVSATVHLARVYLTPAPGLTAPRQDIDLAAGLLARIAQGPGWDVPEVWYLLGMAYRMQGRREKERECLGRALECVEGRGVRDLGSAVGLCL